MNGSKSIAASVDYTEQRPPLKGLAVAAAVLAGVIAFLVFMQTGELPAKTWLSLAAGAGFFVIAFASGQPKAVLLGSWVFALTYNRQYFIFEPLVGKQGGQGPYLIVSDAFLIALLGLWAWDLILNKQMPKPKGGAIWPWLLPLLVASTISVLQSAVPAWGAFEMIRYVKIAIILFYFRYQVGPREWWACVFGIIGAVVFQAAVGMGEMITGRSGVLGIFGLAHEEVIPEALQQERFYGWHRATATMSHPPNLACYLLFMIPILFALAFGTRDRRIRIPALFGGLIGLGGLACTLSRWPCALMVLELALLLAGLVALRLCSAKVAIGAAAVGLLVAGIGVITFRDFIVDRLMRDLDASIDFRTKDDTTGLRMAADYPLFGVGLNNYFHYLIQYEPEWEWALQYEDLAVKNHTRPLAAPHSAYLAILAETGVVGLLAYFVFLWGVVRTAVRATARTSGVYQAISFAFLIGLVGLFLQQLVDFSLLVDPLLYSMALIMGLSNIAPDLFRVAQPRVSALEPAISFDKNNLAWKRT